VCDTDTNTCVGGGCTMTSDCDGGQVCDTETQTCVECTMTSDCDGGQVCDTDTHTCVDGGCTMTSDCEGGLVCETETQTCVECTQDNDCEAGQGCSDQHECVPLADALVLDRSVEGGGCACTVPGGASSRLHPLVLLALALPFVRRRRRAVS
ncbi:MAG TPA: MYXO-CTERM sorting domain-containing protein, partial [Polyangiaceae bacterium]|nr:MYXO-CTERM sorting domain-containing protein [Polyangiaceae bacterium]